MIAKGNCFDNAPIESFWGVLKNELVYHQDYRARFEAISDIIGYIELYYNKTRIQTLDMLILQSSIQAFKPSLGYRT